MRSHFKGAQLEQTQPQAQTFGRIQLVNTKLGPMRISRDVDEQVAKQSIDNFWRAVLLRDLAESYFQFI